MNQQGQNFRQPGGAQTSGVQTPGVPYTAPNPGATPINPIPNQGATPVNPIPNAGNAPINPIPNAGAASAATPVNPVHKPAAEPVYVAPSAPTKVKMKGSGLLTTFIIITFIFCVVNSVFIGLLFFNNNDEPMTAEEQLAETKAYNAYTRQVAADSIEVGKFAISETYEEGLDFECEIKNKSKKDLDDVYIYYNIYDANGNFIGSTYSYIPRLTAKSSITLYETGWFEGATKVTVSDTFAVYSEDIY